MEISKGYKGPTARPHEQAEPPPRRCNCSVSWEATGGGSIGRGCTSRAALLAAAGPTKLRRRRSVPFSYYQVQGGQRITVQGSLYQGRATQLWAPDEAPRSPIAACGACTLIGASDAVAVRALCATP